MIRERLYALATKAFAPKRAPIGHSLNFPLGWTPQQYLQTYGSVGWVYACTSRIAQSVGEAAYHLYHEVKGDYEEVDDHPLLDVMDDMTPFHTHAEAFEICQTYLELMGEWWMLIFRDGAGNVRELWPVNPRQMSIVPDPTEFIKGYVFNSSDGFTKIPLEKRDVFYLKTPNPMNPYRGMGVIESIMADVEGERFSALWNRNFFANGATVGGVIEVPGTLSEEAYERLRDQWKQEHQGAARAHKTAILEGGAKYTEPKIGQRDMDFVKMREVNRDIILGAFGMPAHILGLEESTNRATAESAEYVFSRWVILPRLKRIAGKINEFLLPQFPRSQGMVFEFEDPTPENDEFDLQQAREGFTGGFLTRNEARALIGMDDLGDVGDVFMVPITLIPLPKDENPTELMPLPQEENPAEEQTEALPTVKDISDEVRWDVFVKRLTPMEKKYSQWLKEEFKQQEKETLAKIGKSRSKIFGDLYAADEYATRLASGSMPYLRAMLILAAEAAASEVGSMFDVTNPRVLEWLGYRSREFGILETKTLSTQIATQLQEAARLGESIDQMTKRLQTNVFGRAVSRAETIARTEMVGSSNQGALEAYKQSGVVRQKQWLAAMDERTRDTHLVVHEQNGLIDLEADFRVGAGSGPAPGQINRAEESINCRCTLKPILARHLREARCPDCGRLLGKDVSQAKLYCRHCKKEIEFRH